MHYDESHCGNTYVYTVEEIDNGESGYSYDRNIYKLTVKVVPSDHGISLETYITDDTGEVSEMVFTNSYSGKDKNPPEDSDDDDGPGHGSGGSSSNVRTGDDNNLRLWAMLAGISMIGVMLLVFLQKKGHKDN